MNVLYKGVESINGIQEKIITPLMEDGVINKLILVSRSDDVIPNSGKNVVDISASFAWSHNLEHYIQKKDWLSIPCDILEKMRVYEPDCLYMVNRFTNFDVYTINEAYDEYMYYLQFWYTVIRNENVNCFISPYIPHCTWEYVIYALCKVMEIPTLILCCTSIPSRFVYGTDFDNIGDNIFENFKQSNLPDEIQNLYIKNFYLNCKNRTPNTDLKFLGGGASSKAKWKKNVQVEVLRYINFKYISKLGLSVIKNLFCHIFKKDNLSREVLDRKIYMFKLGVRSLRKYHSEKKVEFYDDMAVFPREHEQYIYFALHLQPEATTLPMGGVFHNQLTAIKVLSEAVKDLNIKIYVKEHFVQTSRAKTFYKELSEIPGVVLIKTCVDSTLLEDKSIAVASITGTCLLEAVIRGKPALAFGKVYCWKGMPGLVKIDDSEQCRKMLKDIQINNFEIDEISLKQYFNAIEKGSVINFAYSSELENIKEDNAFEGFQKLIRNFLEKCINGNN